MKYLKNGPSATAVISGRNIAHGKWSATQAGLLGADLVRGNVTFSGFTDKQAAQLSGSSFAYLRLALQIVDVPVLRARVERGELSLLAAVQSLRPSQKQPKQPKQQQKPQPARSLFELFENAPASERRECMLAHLDEAFELIDSTTAPGNGVSKPNGMFARH